MRGTLFFLCTATLPRSSVIVQAYLVRPGCFFLLLLILGKLAMLDACTPHITGILFVVEFWVQGRWIPTVAAVVVIVCYSLSLFTI